MRKYHNINHTDFLFLLMMQLCQKRVQFELFLLDLLSIRVLRLEAWSIEEKGR